MIDVTNQVADLQRARIEMQTEKKLIEIEVKQRYAQKINEEIRERTETAERIFANKLRDANNSGVPQSIIRKEVLRTNTWERWTYWRDLAQIEPDRVVATNAKAARDLANSPFRWSEDYATLTVLRDSTGAEIVEPLIYDLSTNVKTPQGLYWPDPSNMSNERAVISEDLGYKKFLSAEIAAQIEGGNVSAI